MYSSRTLPLDEKGAGLATVMAVASGKGGVGKSNIAANMAIAAASAGQRVIVFDADMGLANQDVIFNIDSKYNLWHVVKGFKSLDEIIQVAAGGVEVICGASGLGEMADLTTFQSSRLIEDLSRLQEEADLIIIDTGAGIDKKVVGFCLNADHTLVVTTPEPTAMTDAYAMIKVLSSQNYQGRISLVVNMADSLKEGRQVYRQISQVAMRFLDMPVYEAGILLRDDKMLASVRDRRPILLGYPKSQAALAIATMVSRLERRTVGAERRQGFFKKVVNWLF